MTLDQIKEDLLNQWIKHKWFFKRNSDGNVIKYHDLKRVMTLLNSDIGRNIIRKELDDGK